ncbi:DNA-repair protein complementing XP-C cells-like protein [Trichinella spiralis]|uniref:DNA-repair protein complementing XP-C cells-like protein n=1 Tax=Trichinella spiralis TaxID=6334 RepID=UPI0001EFBFAF|nr:DNA-repair protein complementing XP-C cells-like protein [Trichinella spiralis]
MLVMISCQLCFILDLMRCFICGIFMSKKVDSQKLLEEVQHQKAQIKAQYSAKKTNTDEHAHIRETEKRKNLLEELQEEKMQIMLKKPHLASKINTGNSNRSSSESTPTTTYKGCSVAIMRRT